MSKSEEKSFIQFLMNILKWKRFLFIIVSLFTIAALVISLFLPKWYRAETKILGGRSELSDLGLSSFAENLPLEGLGLIPKSDKTLRYLAILNSRTVMLNIIDRFNLQIRYKKPNWEKTLIFLQKNVSFEVNPDETISIFVLDKSPEMASKIANSFVKMLDSLNIHLKVEKARNNRKFLNTRLERCKLDLSIAEQNLKNFQEEYGLIDISEQSKATINTISQLEAEILDKETELRYKRHYLSEYHLDIENLITQINELKESLQRIKYGSKNDINDVNGTNEFLIPSKEVPGLAMKYFRLLREVEVQNILYKLLTQQFEQSKILEAKETPTVQVLDWAVPPIQKYRPKRAFIVLGAFFFSSFISLCFVAGIERWRRFRFDLQQQINKNVI
ncbi:MAG: GumC family protein [bacterium]